MVQWLRALTVALPEVQGLIPDTHMEAHHHLWLQSSRLWCPLLPSTGTECMWCIDVHAGKIPHTQNKGKNIWMLFVIRTHLYLEIVVIKYLFLKIKNNYINEVSSINMRKVCRLQNRSYLLFSFLGSHKLFMGIPYILIFCSFLLLENNRYYLPRIFPVITIFSSHISATEKAILTKLRIFL